MKKTARSTKDNHYGGKDGEACLRTIQNIFFYNNFTAIEGFYIGNIIKYLWRFHNKNGVKDLHKAKKYLEYLIKENK